VAMDGIREPNGHGILSQVRRMGIRGNIMGDLQSRRVALSRIVVDRRLHEETTTRTSAFSTPTGFPPHVITHHTRLSLLPALLCMVVVVIN